MHRAISGGCFADSSLTVGTPMASCAREATDGCSDSQRRWETPALAVAPPRSSSWRGDETYIKVRGTWAYPHTCTPDRDRRPHAARGPRRACSSVDHNLYFSIENLVVNMKSRGHFRRKYGAFLIVLNHLCLTAKNIPSSIGATAPSNGLTGLQ